MVQIALRPEETILREFSISQGFFWLLIVVGLGLIFVVPSLLIWLLGLLAIPTEGVVMIVSIGVGLAIGLAMVIYALYFRAARNYLLTTQRVITTIGFLSRQTISAEYEDITDIQVSQDPFERFILNAGRVAINTAGGDIQEIQLERIADPYKISDQIREFCERWFKSHRTNGGRALSTDAVAPPS